MAQRVIDLFFGPLDGTEWIMRFIPGWTMAQIMVNADIFPSVTQAHENGYGGPIPPGYSQHICGKNRRRIYILNQF